MLHSFLENFLHNLFKPLLLFFYFGFLLRILKVDFEFPYVIYQGLTMYLLIAIGWHGGEELAEIKASSIAKILGFLATGFVVNVVIPMYWGDPAVPCSPIPNSRVFDQIESNP